jgi:hypothetical protein
VKIKKLSKLKQQHLLKHLQNWVKLRNKKHKLVKLVLSNQKHKLSKTTISLMLSLKK